MHQSLQALHCPQCGNTYDNGDIGVLRETDNNILATITCSKCQHQSVVTMALGQMQSAGLSSDLKAPELTRLLDQDPITTDDLLDIHTYLKKTKGDFAKDLATKVK